MCVIHSDHDTSLPPARLACPARKTVKEPIRGTRRLFQVTVNAVTTQNGRGRRDLITKQLSVLNFARTAFLKKIKSKSVSSLLLKALITKNARLT